MKMCNFFSGIITQDGTVMHNANESDSHEDIISKFSLRDDTSDPDLMQWARFEITPPDGDVSKPFNEWKFKIDQAITPSWFNDGYKQFCFDSLIEFSKDHFITDEIEEISSGRYWMFGTARVGEMSGTARVDRMFGTASVGRMFDTARVDRMFGTASVGRMFGTARVGEMFGTASVDRMSGTASVGEMSGTARVGEMFGTASVGRMFDTASVDRMFDTARVGEMFGTARVGEMFGTASVGEMFDTASVGEIKERAIVICNDKIIVASGSAFKISRAGKVTSGTKKKSGIREATA